MHSGHPFLFDYLAGRGGLESSTATDPYSALPPLSMTTRLWDRWLMRMMGCRREAPGEKRTLDRALTYIRKPPSLTNEDAV